MTADPTTPDALLRLWIATHGNMEPKYRDKFKVRPELDELIHYERKVLKNPFSQSGLMHGFRYIKAAGVRRLYWHSGTPPAISTLHYD